MLIEKIKEAFIRRSQTSTRDRLGAADAERLAHMFAAMKNGSIHTQPSRYWEELNKMNMAQLRQNGYENFKRTIALNYFTWTRLLPWDSQILFLCGKLPIGTLLDAAIRTFRYGRQSYFSATSIPQALAYSFLTMLQWSYLSRLSLNSRLLKLREPPQGNPPLVQARGGLKLSQDLANSILEYDSFSPAMPERPAVVLELGAGYGRNAFVVLKIHADVKYIIVDIPPALWVAERYLSEVFPERTIFRFRDFEDFAQVSEKFDKADIVFLLASQISCLPDRLCDLILNISSLHEMRAEQISYYFEQFDRTLRIGGHMYMKQWRHAKVLFEGTSLVESDYPVPLGWDTVFSRVARVQTRFFEALYKKSR